MLVAGSLLVLVVAFVAVLALAPRLRVFDDRRARVGFLVVLAGVALVVPLGLVAAVDRTADAREDDAVDELYAWLSSRTYAEVGAATAFDPAAAPGVAVVRNDDGAVVLERPVEVAWQRRCVIGRYPTDGLPSVRRTSSPCP